MECEQWELVNELLYQVDELIKRSWKVMDNDMRGWFITHYLTAAIDTIAHSLDNKKETVDFVLDIIEKYYESKTT